MNTSNTPTNKGQAMLKHLPTLAIAAALLASGCAQQAKDNDVQAVRAASTVQVQEDSPLFDCLTMGDHVCEPPTSSQQAKAWAKWDEVQPSVIVDPAQPYRITFHGVAQTAPAPADHRITVTASPNEHYIFYIWR